MAAKFFSSNHSNVESGAGSRPSRWSSRFLAALLTLLAAGMAQAFEFQGRHDIVLHNGGAVRERIGEVEFSPVGDGRARFVVRVDESRLGEYFLAMRPFRCLVGPEQRLCHFPAAREAPVVGADDLVPLEYALMFLRTAPASLHLNPFNGVYYQLRVGPTRIDGRLYEVDMDPFITPDSVPPERRQRPLRPADLSPADPAGHWLPFLSIE